MVQRRRLGTRCPVFAWTTVTLVHIDITVTAETLTGGTFFYTAFSLVLFDEFVPTNAVGKSGCARAPIGVKAH